MTSISICGRARTTRSVACDRQSARRNRQPSTRPKKFVWASNNALIAGAPKLLAPNAAPGQARDDPSLSIELIDPKVFRVCADPHNLPFSNEAGEGFENKLAELTARKLDKSLAYSWFPQSVGF